ncbi:MAG TPA: type IV pilus modification protein PilV [Rhodanobacteraceae bacterium]|nr:type IV pilus modification protein PilV [Rhodanobacteraceae bacterium]
MPATRNRTGFGLIEVLVAVLVFSLGLIGLAGLMVMSTQANHGAFIRTQATFLAQNMADRMRANPVGLWADAYDDTYPVTGTALACSEASPCTPAQVAVRDKQQWSTMLKQLLPDDDNLKTTSIECTSDDATALASIPSFSAKRAPYDGTCTMKITWTERSLSIGEAAAPQTFAWVFQP